MVKLRVTLLLFQTDEMLKLLSSVQACQLTADETANYLEVDTSVGLASDEVVRRRSIHGNNDFDISEDKPLWKKYLEQVFFISFYSCSFLNRRKDFGKMYFYPPDQPKIYVCLIRL